MNPSPVTHTPTPWHRSILSGFVGGRKEYRIVASDQSCNGGKIIARFHGPDAEANSRLVVEACNNYPKAQADLKEALKALESLANTAEADVFNSLDEEEAKQHSRLSRAIDKARELLNRIQA